MSNEETENTNINDSKFLTFNIGAEQYGINIENVIELIEMIKITPIPETNQYIKGVINLRGKVIPVMSVRARFELPDREYDAKTCIIVVQVNQLEIGLIVDSVSEVVEIPAEEIEPPPPVDKNSSKKFVMGMGKIEDQVTILLNLGNMLFIDLPELEKACA